MVDTPKALDLPIDMDNEALVLSNAIKDTTNLQIFLRRVNFLDFRYKEYQTVAWAIKAACDAGMGLNTDAILLKSKTCPVKYHLDFEFVEAIINNFPQVSAFNFDQHLVKLHLDKTKQEIANMFFKSIYPACLNPGSTLDFLNERLKNANAILEKGYSYSQSQFKSMKEVVEDFREYKLSDKGFYTTGFRQLDEKLTEGYKPRGVTIICGLPSMGKSSLTLSSMYNLNNIGVWCPQFALEMDSMAITTKLASFGSKIPVKRIAKEFTKLSDEERKLLDYELQRLSESKFMYLNDTPGQSLSTIKEQIMILQDHLKTEYMFVSIDLFGKIREFQSSGDSFAFDYEKKLNQVQIMAKELGINFGLVAQIHRAVMQRKFNRPKMSDIKNAGAWEEVADLILAIHRPYYDPEVALKQEIAHSSVSEESPTDEDQMNDPNKNLAEVLILKQRMGAANKLVNFLFDPETTRYSAIVPEFQQEINSEKIELNDGDIEGYL